LAALFLCFVVNAAKVEDAMDDDTVQFFGEVGVQQFGVCLDCIKADEEVAGDSVPLSIVEGDDIGVVIVLQVLPVYFQNLFVRTEYATDSSRLFTVPRHYRPYPTGDIPTPEGRKGNIFSMKRYCHN
jgi:hypothetical protein